MTINDTQMEYIASMFNRDELEDLLNDCGILCAHIMEYSSEIARKDHERKYNEIMQGGINNRLDLVALGNIANQQSENDPSGRAIRAWEDNIYFAIKLLKTYDKAHGLSP